MDDSTQQIIQLVLCIGDDIYQKKLGVGANPEYNQYISEVRTSSQTVFTQDQNELFVQQVVQYSR